MQRKQGGEGEREDERRRGLKTELEDNSGGHNTHLRTERQRLCLFCVQRY